MNPLQHIDAISTAFFGLLAIWAAIVRRHWFLRFAVVGVALLAALLIPAYDLAITFGIQIGLILLAVWLARGRQQWKPRLSLETAFLLTGVVAIATAVYVRVPHLPWSRWTEVLSDGISSAFLAIVCLWIVTGNAPLRFRLFFGLVGIVALLPLMHFGLALQRGVEWWQVGKDGWPTFMRFYDPEYLRTWPPTQIPKLFYGCTLFIAVLTLTRASGWFSDQESPPQSSRRHMQIGARAGLIGMSLFIATPIAYLFFRLLTPEPLPNTSLPVPNGHDDFVAAGQLTPPNLLIKARQVFAAASGSPILSQVQAELQLLQPVYDRIEAGQHRDSAMDLRVLANPAQQTQRNDERDALRSAGEALWLKYAYQTKQGKVAGEAESLLEILAFVNKAYRGTGITWLDYSDSGDAADYVVSSLGDMLPQCGAAECRDVARRLEELDRAHEPWEQRVHVERLLDIHEDWRSHLRIVLSEMGGWDPYEGHQDDWLRRLEQHRSVTMAHAVRAYCLECREPPPNAEALVPEYLVAVPEDPYNGKPMKLKTTKTTVIIYSVGKNGIDDDGVPHPIDSKRRVYTDQQDSARVLNQAELGTP